MAYSAYALANAFISVAKAQNSTGMTHSRLQILIYKANLKEIEHKGEPLIDDFFVNSLHGPVVKSLFYKIRGMGDHPLIDLIPVASSSRNSRKFPCIPDNDTDSWAIVFLVASQTLHLTTAQLIEEHTKIELTV